MKSFKNCISEINEDIRAKSRSRTISGMNSEDIYQELYLCLFRGFPEFDEEKSSFRTWADLKMKNKLIDLWRKTQLEFITDKNGFSVRREIATSDFQQVKEQNAKDDENGINFYENLGDGGNQVEQMIDNIDFQLALNRAKIGESDKVILRLYKDGYTFREIAEHKHTGKSSIGRRIKSIFQRLSQYL
jgi:RNA polymerase sigma factor (sigma-70 family)